MKPPDVNYFYPNRSWWVELKCTGQCKLGILNKLGRCSKLWRAENGFVCVNETEGGRVWKRSIWQHKAIEFRERFCHISRTVRICCSYLTPTQHNVYSLLHRHPLRDSILFYHFVTTNAYNSMQYKLYIHAYKCYNVLYYVINTWHSQKGFPSICLASALL